MEIIKLFFSKIVWHGSIYIIYKYIFVYIGIHIACV